MRHKKSIGTQRQCDEVDWCRKSKGKAKEMAKIEGGEQKGT